MLVTDLIIMSNAEVESKKSEKRIGGECIPKWAKYRIDYFDPSDPDGERGKTWFFKTREDGRPTQLDLMTCWKIRGSEVPIKKIIR
ncbi:unnamed protein product [marine sediment metagenome]|uniref:Uncharacterized protein n=1 Tax=marine sediment metagenome TaxID=412755 RepID=X1AD46_9ZZZZ